MSDYNQALNTVSEKREEYMHRVKCYLLYIMTTNTSNHLRDTWGSIKWCLGLWLEAIDNDRLNPIELIEIYCDNQVNLYTQLYDEYRIYPQGSNDDLVVKLRSFLNTVSRDLLYHNLITRETYFITDNKRRGPGMRKDSDYMNLSNSRAEKPIIPPHEDLKHDVCPAFIGALPKLKHKSGYMGFSYPFAPKVIPLGPYLTKGCEK